MDHPANKIYSKETFYTRLIAFLCRHNEVGVIRYHKDCVPNEWKGKELYVDVHRVVNFVRCRKCLTILNGVQTEKLFEAEYPL